MTDDEYRRMVERGTKAWANVPNASDWVDDLRGGTDELTLRDSEGNVTLDGAAPSNEGINVRTMTRTIRVFDHGATPVDVQIDFTGAGDMEGKYKDVVFFELEQEQSVFLTIEGIEAVLAAAKQLKDECGRIEK